MTEDERDIRAMAWFGAGTITVLALAALGLLLAVTL